MSECAAIETLAELPAVCWHCQGAGVCSCISCAIGVWGKPEPGPCVACQSRSEAFDPESQPEQESEPQKEDRPITEPEWTGGFRGRVAKFLWDRGLERKAIRFLNCGKCARPGVCRRYPFEHKFFVPHGCEVVFCRECADEARRVLTLAYLAVVLAAIVGLGGIPDGWVLARVTFTLRSDGCEITPGRVKAMNTCVGAVMRRAVGSRKGYGFLFVDEVGFEKRGHLPDAQRVAHGLNLHVHGLYFGPRLDWERTRDLWMEVTGEKVGVESRGFFITAVRRFAENPERAVRWALNHMLKYVSKPPAISPERLASLIAAFDGARRVHSLGLFYGKKPKRERKDCPCPKCRAMGIVSTVEFEGSALPDGGCIPRLAAIEELVAGGYVPLREAGRDAVLAMGASREDSWGASP
jgi:hypothetical protein